MRSRKTWAAIAGSYTCSIEFSAEEMAEHERHLEGFRCYQAAVAALFIVRRMGENYDVVRELFGRLDETWDEG